VLHTGETGLSAPLTTSTGLSAVEEITEGGLTDSRTASTANRLSLSMPPSDNELGLLSYLDRKDPEVNKESKNIFGRLRGAMISERLASRLSIPWSVLAPTSPAVKVPICSSEKPSPIPHTRPKNKLRKKTRPSIAITLAVEPPSSFSLAQLQNGQSQPLPRSLEALQTSTNPVSVSPVAGFPSAMSFLSFQLPPVFSRARSKMFQKSPHRPPNDMDVINRASTVDRPDVDPSGFWTRKSGGRVSRDSHSGENSETTVPVGDNGIGGFPTPIRSAGHHDRRGSRERSPVRGMPGRIPASWELGLGLGQSLGLKVCSLWRARGR